MGLFREEVIKAQQYKGLGEINLATPLSFKWWVLLAIVLTASALSLLAFGSYTRHESVSGRLVDDAGSIMLSTDIAGTVSHLLIHEGEKVHTGQVLAEVSAPAGTLVDPHENGTLRAPAAGIITTRLVQSGQQITKGQPLFAFRPVAPRLMAELLVPGDVIGSVSPGSRVVIRYPAFPYQTHAQQFGRIVRVFRDATDPTDAASVLGPRYNDHTATMPFYRVMASLDRLQIEDRGRLLALQPGTALSADLTLDRRRLLTWALSPLRGTDRQAHGNEGESSR